MLRCPITLRRHLSERRASRRVARRSKSFGTSIYRLLGLRSHTDAGSTSAAPKAFYTAALNADIAAVLESADFGWLHTPHLKIKVNNDVEFWCVRRSTACFWYCAVACCWWWRLQRGCVVATPAAAAPA